uniref:Uncharacterized protein n=1 Tax=Tetranychus urticae TaxID=32264 RepID=T1KA59_TETUR
MKPMSHIVVCNCEQEQKKSQQNVKNLALLFFTVTEAGFGVDIGLENWTLSDTLKELNFVREKAIAAGASDAQSAAQTETEEMHGLF